MSKKIKHIIKADQFNKTYLFKLFSLADHMRSSPKLYRSTLDGQYIAAIFFEPSTRTRLSFVSAIQRLGGRTLETENANENSSGKKGETIEDTVRTLSCLSDGIIMRHPADDSAVRAAKVSSVPVINAGSGKSEHPTQGLLDLYTIYKNKGRIEDLKPAFLGDLKYGRTNHSLIKMLVSLGNKEIHGVSSKELALEPEYQKYIKSNGAKYVQHYSLDTLPRDVDLIYHSRIQKERLNGDDISRSMLTINKNTLNEFSKDTILMHPLPRNEEIATCVDGDPRAVFFNQVENGLYIRMALLFDILGKTK
ncbi:MAG: aspartate carbamoyltransferase [Rickettsiales bacterium]|nr:aspartate carbamoyltransferase [Rickettsiales bacterium]